MKNTVKQERENREVRLSVRITARDMAELEKLAVEYSPLARLSYGKVLSALLAERKSKLGK